MIPLKSARYDDRETLKDKGAKWSPEDKYWYVPDGRDPGAFRDYMDPLTDINFDLLKNREERKIAE